MKYNKIVKGNNYNKNSFLITTISCIVLLLMLCYFGINSGVKGTYSSDVTCPSGSTAVSGKCCPTGYTSGVVGDKCVNSDYSSAHGKCYYSKSTYDITQKNTYVSQGFTCTEQNSGRWDCTGTLPISNCSEPSVSPVTVTNHTYTATFNKNGGTLSGSSTKSCTTNNSSSCTISSLPTATKSGYSFKGWGASSTCTSGVTTTLTLNANKKYYACWKKIEDTTTPTSSCYYCSNGSETNTNGDVIKYAWGTASTYYGSTSYKLGTYCTVNSSYTSKSSCEANNEGAKCYYCSNGSETDTSGNVIKYAWGKASTYYGSTSYKLGTYCTASSSYASKSSCEGANKKACFTSSAGGYFWAIHSQFDGKNGYWEATQYTTEAACKGANTTGTNIKYIINYDANGGDVSSIPSPQTKSKGNSISLSAIKPSRTGYTFNKWNTKPDGSGTSYSVGATYSADADLELFAQWIRNSTGGTEKPDDSSGGSTGGDGTSGGDSNEKTFKATFDPNGGDLEGSKTATCTGETKCSVNVPASEKIGRDGYVFDGWGTTTTCKNGYKDTVSLTKEETTFYACWKSSGGSNTKPDADDNVKENPVTGKTTLMAFIWFLGLMAIGYAFYYFKSAREN